MSETIPDSPDAQGVALIAALKAARAALGWSQQELARASGISKVTIARMEAGMMSPRLSTLSSLLATMERAGIQLTLNAPTGGFSMEVERRALGKWREPSEATRILGELGATVNLKEVGLPQVDKRGITGPKQPKRLPGNT